MLCCTVEAKKKKIEMWQEKERSHHRFCPVFIYFYAKHLIYEFFRGTEQMDIRLSTNDNMRKLKGEESEKAVSVSISDLSNFHFFRRPDT